MSETGESPKPKEFVYERSSKGRIDEEEITEAMRQIRANPNFEIIGVIGEKDSPTIRNFGNPFRKEDSEERPLELSHIRQALSKAQKVIVREPSAETQKAA